MHFKVSLGEGDTYKRPRKRRRTMGIVSRTKGTMKRNARGAMIIAAAAGAAACLNQSARAANYLVDPNWTGTNGGNAGPYVDENGNTYTSIYTSVSAALGITTTVNGAVPSGASPTSPNLIYIDPGTYTTNTTMAYSKNNVALIGVTGNAGDVVITSTLDSDFQVASGSTFTTLGTTNCATIQLKGNNQTVMNLTIANSTDTPYIIANKTGETPSGTFQSTGFGTAGTVPQSASAPAVALLTQGDEQLFDNVKILGYQDTLYMKGGRNYYLNSTINGDDDAIFANGTSLFSNDTINDDGNHSGGAFTAASTDKRTSNGLVFINDTFTGNSVQGNSIIDPQGDGVATVTPGSISLGRPWGWQQAGGDASVVLINDEITNAVQTAGWIIWNNNETNAANTHNGGNPAEDSRYAEYNSMDLMGNPLNVSSRVSWSHQFNAQQAAAYNLPVQGATTATDVLSNVFASEYNATTNPNGYAWYANGYGDTNDYYGNQPNFPMFWGSRNAENDEFGTSSQDTITGNPAAYSDPTWSVAATSPNWDPFVQLDAIPAVPEPATLSLLGGGAAMLLMRRSKKESTETK
jgi:pectin methylesterase-like acyl-CoA thioesterase